MSKIWILILIILAAAMPVHAELTDDITAYYPFDANPEDVAGDNNGTIEGEGVTLTTGNGGKIGEAYSFDDDDGYIYVPYGTGTSYSYSLWIKLSSVGTVNYITSGQINKYSANLAVSSSGKVGMTVGSADSWNFDGDTTLVADRWYHIGATFDGTIKKIYIDGELETSNEAIGSIDTDTANNIGRRSDGAGYFRGIIDEVGVWDRELSEYEITRLYNSGNGITYPFSLYFTILGNINDFSAIVDDTVYNSSNGTITTDILYNSTQLWNITVSPNDFILNYTYQNYNVSENLGINFTRVSACFIDEDSNILSNYTINITQPNGDIFEETTNSSGCVQRYTNQSGVFNITFLDLSGYKTPVTFNETINEGDLFSNTYQINYTDIVINFYNQETESRITENITVDISDIRSFETVVGQLNITNATIKSGQYTIYAYADNYRLTQITFTYDDQEDINIDMYLLNRTSENIGTVTISVQNNLYDAQVGADVRMQVFDAGSSSFVERGQCITNANGQCLFNIVLGTKIYRFLAIHEIQGQELTAYSSEEGNVIQESGDQYTIYLVPTEDFNLGDRYNLKITPSNTELLDTNISTLKADFSDSAGLSHEVCIGYYYLDDGEEIELTETCITGSSGTVNVVGGYSLNRNYTNIAKIFVKDDGEEIEYYTYRYPSIESYEESLGIFAKPIIILLIAVILGISLYLKNINIFAVAIIVLAYIIKILYPSLIGNVSVGAITIIMILILWTARKKTDNRST